MANEKYVTRIKSVDFEDEERELRTNIVAASAIVAHSPAQEYIDRKAQNLQIQINNLSSDLDEEEAARIAGDAALDDKLEAEIKRAKDSEALLVDLVAIERARAIKREDDIEDALDNEIWRAQDSEAYIISLIGSSVDDERIRAMADLDAERTRATSVESNLNGALRDEISRAQNSEGILSDKIDALATLTNSKQDKLIAGSNITIEADGKTISAADSVKVDDIKLSNIVTSPTHPYSTSNPMATLSDITEGTVKSVATGTGLVGGPITSTGTISVDTNVIQEKLIAGSNIIIASDGRTISAIDTIYDDTTLAGRVTIIEGKEAGWDAKQDALSTEQLAATNSGITDTKVATYDSYAINKQDTLTASTGIVLNGSTIGHSNSIAAQTLGKLGIITYDSQGHITGFVEKAVVNDVTSTAIDQPLAAKQGKVLSDAIAASGNIKVVATKPGVAAAENNTIYYVGTASPYQVYFYAKDSAGVMTEYDMGSTAINLTGYAKTADVDSADAALGTRIDNLALVVSGKQNALDTTQQKAINSGIDSEGVAQIATNKADILTKQDKLIAGTNISIAADEKTISAADEKVTPSTGTSGSLLFGTIGINGKPLASAEITVSNGTDIKTANGIIEAKKVKGAVWNDYAEFRLGLADAGRCVIETGDGDLVLSTERLQPAPNIVSDTYGFSIGETDRAKLPIAVSGRVLAYPFEDRRAYKAGDAVCSGPYGTVSIMSREEIINYPDRIVGIVSEVPNYEKWGSGEVPVNGRIWIKVR